MSSEREQSQARKAAAEPSRATFWRPPAPAAPSGKRRILFVDDDAKVLNGFRRMLREPSWQLSFASNTEAALAHLSEAEFDVVISDVKMPGRDGFALLAAIVESPETRDIPVIMLTGLDDDELKQRALDLGATDLLNKPVRREDLLARIRNALRLRSYVNEIKSQSAVLEQTVARRTRELADSRLDIIWCLARAAEQRDGLTGHHVVRVAAYSSVIARTLGLPDDFVEALTLASPLHDVGKIGVPDNVLNKPSDLTDSEREIIERHCVIGAEILDPDASTTDLFGVWRAALAADAARTPRSLNPVLTMAASIALTHHERWDGTGYPRGLARDEIPLESLIVALADVYDALRSARSYKAAYPEQQTLAMIEEEVGRHFDPEVHSAFKSSLPDIRQIYAQLSDDAGALTARAA